MKIAILETRHLVKKYSDRTVVDHINISVVQRYMKWNEKSKGAVILKKICGVLVIFGGLYLIYTGP